MPTITWTLNTENTPHTVRLVHGYWSGKREIWLDERLIEHGRRLIDGGSHHFFQMDGAAYEISILTNGVTFTYLLIKDGHPIPSDIDTKKGNRAQNQLQNHYFLNQTFYRDLSKILNLDYQPIPGDNTLWRYRLVGLLNGYFTVIQRSSLYKPPRDGWSVLIRHAPLSLPQKAEQEMRSDPRIKQLLGKFKKSKDNFRPSEPATWIFLPLVKNEPVAELAERVRAFQAVVAERTRPVPEGVCESSECRQRWVKDRKLVFINGEPWMYCPDCIAAIPSRGEKAEKEYKAAPAHLLPGVIAATGIAFLGAFVWAAVAILLNITAAATAAFIMAGTVRVMGKVGTKLTAFSLIAATLLTFMSVTLGTLATNVLVLLHIGYPLTGQIFIEAWNGMIGDPTPLLLGIGFSLFVVVPYLWTFWLQRKLALSGAFKPQVEVLPGNF